MRTTLALPDDLDRARGLGHGCGFRAFALCPEPPGLDRYLAEWADGLGRGHWTDADLTEFALTEATGWGASMGTPPGRPAWSF